MKLASELEALGKITGNRISQIVREVATQPMKPATKPAVAGSLIQDVGKLTIGGRATVYNQQTWDHANRGIAFFPALRVPRLSAYAAGYYRPIPPQR